MRNPMTYRIAAGVAVLLLVVIAFSIGRCGSCESSEREVSPVVGIDAGPGEAVIAGRLAQQEAQAIAEIAKINAARDREIAAFTAAQEIEYQRVAAEGPEALSAWFSEFNQRIIRDGGK